MSVRDKPELVIRKTKDGLFADNLFTEEEMATAPIGKRFELRPLAKKGSKLRKTYWAALRHAVESTGMWPTVEQANTELMMRSGFTKKSVAFLERDFYTKMGIDEGIADVLHGVPVVCEVADSLADKTEEEFSHIFRHNIDKLNELVGYDVLGEFLP